MLFGRDYMPSVLNLDSEIIISVLGRLVAGLKGLGMSFVTPRARFMSSGIVFCCAE